MSVEKTKSLSEDTNKTPPHELRVIQEQKQIAEWTTKLGSFIDSNPIFPTLSKYEQELLVEQQGLYLKVLDVLNKRIANFKTSK